MSGTTLDGTPEGPLDTAPAAGRTQDVKVAETFPVGFIGLGAMGLHMAANLVRAGHAVLGCDADPARLSLLRDAVGDTALLHTTPVASEVGERCDVIVLMLPTSRHVAEAVAALREGLRAGALVIDMGSSMPGETRRLGEELAAGGISLIDAPVSGSTTGAEAGSLAIMAGGQDPDIERARPYLEAMGRTIVRTGALGSGHAMKALNNFVYAAGLLAVSEALRIGEAAGLDLEILTDVINSSSGRNVASETKVRQFILPGTYAGAFRLGLMAKDVETAASLASEAGIDATALAACRAAWRRALEAFGPEVDTTMIHKSIGTADT